MLVTQIPCAKGMLHTADPGCRQFLTGITGTLQSFNFANTNNPQLLTGKHSYSFAFNLDLQFNFRQAYTHFLYGNCKVHLGKIAPITLHNFCI